MDHTWGYATDRRLRDENEDSFGVFELPGCTLALVCDGMGGHAGGAEASAVAVRVIHDFLHEHSDMPLERALTEAIGLANQTIYDISRKVRRLLGMGTTVACVALRGDQAWIAHVGDSRVYRVRDREVRLLTRDHTMVNLFVDAELLSPEDAHSHPEAHILARSVGVDRQVEVDVQGPIALTGGDVLIACSDGVHGALEEDEFGDVDWTNLQNGVEQILKRVRNRDGDDNATIVAVSVGEAASDRPPATPVPSPGILDTLPSPTTDGTEIGGLRDPVSEVPRPALRVPDVNQGAFVLEASPLPTAAPPSGEPLVRFDDDPTAPTGSTATTLQADTRPPPRPRRQLAALLGAAVFAGAAVGATILVAASREAAPDDGTAEVSLLYPPDEPPSTAPLEVSAGSPEPAGPPPEADPPPASSEGWSFTPTLPPRTRRAPHRPSRYIQPPPGGPLQLEAVLAARNRECARALDAVRAAMRESMDHATLYTQAWSCFDATHQARLADADVRDVGGFDALRVHFEGHAPTDRVQIQMPAWIRPARGGIEYRLDAFLGSGEVDLFADVMMDRLGGAALADHLVRDVSLEAQAAVALSRIPDPPPEVAQWWARRVYYAARAMEGLPGELIEEYRPELRGEITDQLDLATGGRYSREDSPAEDIPEVVLTAVDTARGRIPPPDVPVAAAPPLPAPADADPDTDTTAPADLRPIIHRGGEAPLPEDLR